MTLFDTLFAAQDLSRVLILAMLSSIGLVIGGGRLVRHSRNFRHWAMPGVVSGAFAALAVLQAVSLGQSTLARWALTGLLAAGGMLALLISELSRYAKIKSGNYGREQSSDRPILIRYTSVSVASEILLYSVLLGAAAAASSTTAMAVSAALVLANSEICREAIADYRSAHVSRMDQLSLIHI